MSRGSQAGVEGNPEPWSGTPWASLGKGIWPSWQEAWALEVRGQVWHLTCEMQRRFNNLLRDLWLEMSAGLLNGGHAGKEQQKGAGQQKTAGAEAPASTGRRHPVPPGPTTLLRTWVATGIETNHLLWCLSIWGHRPILTCEPKMRGHGSQAPSGSGPTGQLQGTTGPGK